MSMFKEFAMPPLVLTVIAAVVTGALVATESVTTPIIEQQAAAAADAARAVVLPSADSFTQVTVDEMPEGGVDIYEANNGTGYVVTAQAKGYGGMLKVMVGIDSNGLISGTEVLENNETQGLGSKVSEHAFMDQYIGKDSTLEGIETISGTTISSNAFSKAVQNAYQVYGVAAGVEVAGTQRDPITDEVKAELFPNVTSFQKYAVEGEAYKAGDEGYIVVTSNAGFAGDVTTAIGFDLNGAITGVVFTETSETQDYGEQYTRASWKDAQVGKTSADELDLISGATVTYDALKLNFTEAFEMLPTLADASLEYEGTAEGYNGTMTVAVGIDSTGAITSVRLVDSADDFASKVSDEAFTSQFVGKTSTDGISTISGATVSSTAFIEAVNNALAAQKGA
ncbi:FMN-binding protein [Hydrogenoanaerobacterium saccharovorans]|uniref:Ion-translocating oxidoreductase complex subunit G n=1 Tax=Hydrogenoanaerobacterium saccharovorans TaxID=474960 RepID=A0ABS2GLE3_9FIRM|nr:FMN-binding protein [Hydrogenoanaerobacterium saccharovorans]MBM6922269.1 FMN-binding protein [Hydrogenoanaerobacterium saccharovorans]